MRSYRWNNVSLALAASAALAACGTEGRDTQPSGGPLGDEGDALTGDGGDTTAGADIDGDGDGDTGIFDVGAGDEGGPGGQPGGDPTTCEGANEFKTYLGCDFWPTVTANSVWNVFDFAVVVANAGDAPAEVTVERAGTAIGETTTIPPNELRTIFLPWVHELKGPEAEPCGNVAEPLAATVRSEGGAYHLQSSVPVTVYQFNALEYAPAGGPEGKDWSSCPAAECDVECFSYSNDASLLLPSPALTTNYRVTGYPGTGIGSTLSITGIEDGTDVTVTLSSTGAIMAGGGVPTTAGGGVAQLSLDRGDVVELVAPPDADLSGSLVQSSASVQVIFGTPCSTVPTNVAACDHIEESVFPAETLGSHYFVTVPTSPNGAPVAHLVRIYGNVDGTQLSYPGGKPEGFPDVINAGQVVEVGKADPLFDITMNPPFYWDLSVVTDFEIEGDHEFAVATFQFGAEALGGADIASERGDPSQSLVTAVEQFRTKYVFLAPLDYPVSYVDVVQPMAAVVEIDGVEATGPLTSISSGYGVRRVTLTNTGDGAHVLTADKPVGIQVMGYGDYTSFQYPGGLNLEVIAPPPPPPAG